MKWPRKLLSIAVMLLAGFFLQASGVMAQQLVYQPINPAFGGSPLNYQWMLSSANAQNLYKSSGYSYSRDPFDDFQQSLQRQVLAELTRNLVRDRFGDNFDLTQDSRFEFGEFTIDITPGIDGVTVSIFNVLTGETTNITIPNING
jgi:curli production assembly/transport component CsgF